MTVTGLLLFSKLPFDANSKANHIVDKQQQRQSKQTTDCVHQQQLRYHSLVLLMTVTVLPFGADSQVTKTALQTNTTALKHTTDCVHQQPLCYLWLLLADDCHSASLRRKHLQAVGQVTHIVLPQDEDQILGLAADGVTGLIQGDVLDGALGGHPVHLVLLKGLSRILRGLLHWKELACKRINSVSTI